MAAWPVPSMVYGAGGYAPSVDLSEELEADARRRLEEVVSSGETPGVEVESVVSEGQPAQVLLAEAAPAELLVVGSRGRGGFRGLLLGSVSQQCAQHSPCPITILPRRAD